MTNIVALKHFKKINSGNNTAALLIEVKAVLYKYNGHHSPYLTLYDTNSDLYVYNQKLHKSRTLYYNTFQALVEMAKHHCGNLCQNDTLTKIEVLKDDENCDLADLNRSEIEIYKVIS